MDRLTLAKWLVDAGYHVIAAFNPMYHPWASETDIRALYDALNEDGITHFYCQGLHLSPRRLAGYTAERRARLMAGEPGEFVFDEELADSYAWGFVSFLEEQKKSCFINNVIFEQDFWEPLEKKFKVMPTNEGFQAWCHQKLISGKDYSIKVTFEDYLAYMSKGRESLFNRAFPKGQIDRYIFSANLTLWKKYQAVDSLAMLCNILWNNKHLSGIPSNPAFWPTGDGKQTEKDSNGNNIYEYNGTLR
jgi:hypothetical protein